MGGALVHQRQQQGLGEDIGLQTGLPCGGGGAYLHVGDPPFGIGGEEGGQPGVRRGFGRGNGGDVGVGGKVAFKGLGNGQVGCQIAGGEDHIVLPDVLKVGVDSGKSVHPALITVAVMLAREAEGGQDAQSAPFAA